MLRLKSKYASPFRAAPGLTLCVLALWTACNAPAVENKALGFRGDGSGRFPAATPPAVWNEDGKKNVNVLWSAKIGESRYSSATVAGGHACLTADPDQLFCVDADKGTVLWHKAVTYADLPEKVAETEARGDCGNTTATPATDGERVYAVFGNNLVACFDAQGERKWIRHFPEECATEHGRSASPVLAGDKLILSIGCLQGVDAKTGKPLWKAEKSPEQYGTPVVMQVDGVDVIVAPSGLTQSLVKASPLVAGGVVYMIDTSAAAFQVGPKIVGDTLEVKKLWEKDLEGEFFASPVYDNDLVYTLSDFGKYYVIDAKTGNILLEKDLDIPNGSGRPGIQPANIYGSLCCAGQSVFLSDNIGDIFVLKPGKEYVEVKRNKISEGSGGTPFFAGSRIYVRGGDRLYCLGEK